MVHVQNELLNNFLINTVSAIVPYIAHGIRRGKHRGHEVFSNHETTQLLEEFDENQNILLLYGSEICIGFDFRDQSSISTVCQITDDGLRQFVNLDGGSLLD